MYNAVFQYYKLGYFTADQVKGFIGLWITADQANQIINANQTTANQ